MTWVGYAFLSALFAAVTSILAKIGMQGVNSNLATAIRTVVVLVMSWIVVFATGTVSGVRTITPKGYTFIILSGIATGLSWLCYFKALQLGNVSKVAPIDKFSVVITMVLAFVLLHEKPDLKTILGGVLITAGTFVMIF